MASSEMIERVAKAIVENTAKIKWEDCHHTGRAFWLEVARVAIKAMREPTKEMISCAESQFALFADEYRRAIDAALKE